MATDDARERRSFAGLPPGVYLDGASRAAPARTFESGVPLFVGLSATRSLDASRTESFTDWASAEALLRDREASDPLWYAVRGFFENAGRRCRVHLVSGAPALRGALEAGGSLEDVEDVDLVCVPDLMDPGTRRDAHEVAELQREILEHCARMGDRFAILDLEPDAGAGAGRIEARARLSGAGADARGYGAVYGPWITVRRRDSRDALTVVPPSGHVAGVFSRTDSRVGPWKAPANELVEGAVDVEPSWGPERIARLLSLGINAIRSVPGRGIRIWGARTMGAGVAASVPVRRMLVTLKRWIEWNMLDLVLEPNADPLWRSATERLEAQLEQLFRRGALAGRSAREAYYVKCDAETNPPEARERGRLTVELGLAAVSPIEFITVRVDLGRDGAAQLQLLAA